MIAPSINSEESAQSAGAAPEKRIFVVLNPVAGMLNAESARQLILRHCEEHHWLCEIHETRRDEDLSGVVRGAVHAGYDMIVAAGGDGTISLVISGLLHSKIPLGILPVGTGNMMARNFSIPMDIKGALAVLSTDHTIQTLDVMELGKDRCHILNVSVGVSSLVMSRTMREEKRRFGFLAYVWHTLLSILHIDMHRFRVMVDGRPMRFAASELMIANCKFMGLQPQISGLDIQPDDGCLDIFIARPQTFSDFLKIGAAFLFRRKNEEDLNLYHLQARDQIKIQSRVPIPAQADGEEIGTTPLTVRLIPKGVRVITPLPAAPDSVIPMVG